MLAEMTDRRRQILKLVIQAYIETSAPVASEHLMRRYGLNVSSATIRNELAALEDLGFLTHLHTSAGRVPTDAGYRFFVENLMERPSLSAIEQRAIRHEFHRVHTALDQWINLAGMVMARTAQNVSVILPPRGATTRLRSVHLIAIHDTLALAVMVFQDGMVRQQTIGFDVVESQEDLARIARLVNEWCHDASVSQIRDRVEHAHEHIDAVTRELIELVCTTMRQYEDALNTDVRADGLLQLLEQPEFAQTERIKQMLALVQSGQAIAPLIPRVTQSDGVQVIIGAEHERQDMREMSIVLARYGVDDEIVGVLGVVGPTRMPYARAIATVRYIAAVMSDLVGELHGEPRQDGESQLHD
ncbi:MAG: heat-inducible transcription repressor HrcA [Chloroflexi bacterium]|nr:heat-inducible transcription repressor HrcA [Chloroflexota bacterium]